MIKAPNFISKQNKENTNTVSIFPTHAEWVMMTSSNHHPNQRFPLMPTGSAYLGPPADWSMTSIRSQARHHMWPPSQPPGVVHPPPVYWDQYPTAHPAPSCYGPGMPPQIHHPSASCYSSGLPPQIHRPTTHHPMVHSGARVPVHHLPPYEPSQNWLFVPVPSPIQEDPMTTRPQTIQENSSRPPSSQAAKPPSTPSSSRPSSSVGGKILPIPRTNSRAKQRKASGIDGDPGGTPSRGPSPASDISTSERAGSRPNSRPNSRPSSPVEALSEEEIVKKSFWELTAEYFVPFRDDMLSSLHVKECIGLDDSFLVPSLGVFDRADSENLSHIEHTSSVSSSPVNPSAFVSPGLNSQSAHRPHDVPANQADDLHQKTHLAEERGDDLVGGNLSARKAAAMAAARARRDRQAREQLKPASDEDVTKIAEEEGDEVLCEIRALQDDLVGLIANNHERRHRLLKRLPTEVEAETKSRAAWADSEYEPLGKSLAAPELVQLRHQCSTDKSIQSPSSLRVRQRRSESSSGKPRSRSTSCTLCGHAKTSLENPFLYCARCKARAHLRCCWSADPQTGRWLCKTCENAKCDKCGSLENSQDNSMMYCTRCTTVNHRECAGVTLAPAEWTCEPCMSLKDSWGHKRSHQQNIGQATSRRRNMSEADTDDLLESRDCCMCGSGCLNPSNPLVVCDKCSSSFHQVCYGLRSVSGGPWLCNDCGGANIYTELRPECAICFSQDTSAIATPLFRCDTCGVAVHQSCYGCKDVSRPFRCRPCLSGLSDVQCAICPNKGGSLVATTDQRWVHVVCARSLPETGFQCPPDPSRTIAVDTLYPSRFVGTCAVCKIKQGACIPCSTVGCSAVCHPLCGRQGGWCFTSFEENGWLQVHCPQHLPLGAKVFDLQKQQQQFKVMSIQRQLERHQRTPLSFQSSHTVVSGRRRKASSFLGTPSRGVRAKKETPAFLDSPLSFCGSSSDSDHAFSETSLTPCLRSPERRQRTARARKPSSPAEVSLDRTRDGPPICDICDTENCPSACEGDPSLLLKCATCSVYVHYRCYGLKAHPEGAWQCRPCKEGFGDVMPCALCPSRGGAMAQAVDGQWVHVVCAQYVPEICFDKPDELDMVNGLDRIPVLRKKLICRLCKVRGGAPVQCDDGSCKIAYHPLCARAAGYSLVAEDPRDGLGLAFQSFCKTHSRGRARTNSSAAVKAALAISEVGPASLAAQRSQTEAVSREEPCAICDHSGSGSHMLSCKKCSVSVHATCYGIFPVPPGPWICRPCSAGLETAPECALCPVGGGAYSSTTDCRWAHVLCAEHICGIRFDRMEERDDISGLDEVLEVAKEKDCSICHQRQGAYSQCARPNCSVTFHPLCGRAEGCVFLTSSSSSSSDSPPGILCRRHSEEHKEFGKKLLCDRTAAGSCATTPGPTPTAESPFQNPTPTPASPSRLPTDEPKCAVCGNISPPLGVTNCRMAQCDRCDMKVHVECYGFQSVPDVRWFCATCDEGGTSYRPPCKFCPVMDYGLPMKPVKGGGWAHVFCASWIPEADFTSDLRYVSNANKIDKDRWKLKCGVCRLQQGACIQCCAKGCSASMHPICAQRAGYQLLEYRVGHSREKKPFCRNHARDAQKTAEEAQKMVEEALKNWTPQQASQLQQTQQHQFNNNNSDSTSIYTPGASSSFPSPFTTPKSTKRGRAKAAAQRSVPASPVPPPYSSFEASSAGMDVEAEVASATLCRELEEFDERYTLMRRLRRDLEKARMVLDRIVRREKIKRQLIRIQSEELQICLQRCRDTNEIKNRQRQTTSFAPTGRSTLPSSDFHFRRSSHLPTTFDTTPLPHPSSSILQDEPFSILDEGAFLDSMLSLPPSDFPSLSPRSDFPSSSLLLQGMMPISQSSTRNEESPLSSSLEPPQSLSSSPNHNNKKKKSRSDEELHITIDESTMFDLPSLLPTPTRPQPTDSQDFKSTTLPHPTSTTAKKMLGADTIGSAEINTPAAKDTEPNFMNNQTPVYVQGQLFDSRIGNKQRRLQSRSASPLFPPAELQSSLEQQQTVFQNPPVPFRQADNTRDYYSHR